MLTALQLQRVRFLKLEAHENPDFDGRGIELNADAHVGVSFNQGATDDGHVLWPARVFFKASPDPKDEAAYPFRHVLVEAEGLFSLPEDTPAVLINSELLVNSASILYGFVRGAVATSTSMFLGGPVLMPAVSLAEIVESSNPKHQQATSSMIAWLRSHLAEPEKDVKPAKKKASAEKKRPAKKKEHRAKPSES